MLRTIIIVFLSACIVSPVFGEPKKLICTDPVTKEWLDGLASRSTENCKKYGDKYGACQRAEEGRQNQKSCRNADYAWTEIYTFDTNDLSSVNEAFAEHERLTCLPRTDSEASFIERVIMQATPKTITFLAGDVGFHVDRKTLKAGFGVQQRTYKCIIQDIDTSDNQI